MNSHLKKQVKSSADAVQKLHSKARLASLQNRFQSKRQAELLKENPNNFLPQQLNPIIQKLNSENNHLISPLPKNAYPILESLQKAHQYAQFYSPQGALLTVIHDNPSPFTGYQGHQTNFEGFNQNLYQNNNNMCDNVFFNNELPSEKMVLGPNDQRGVNKENWNGRIFLTENKKSTMMLPNFRQNQQNIRPYFGEEIRIKRVGDYEFLKDPRNILGSGAFSVVYAGNHYHQKSMKVAIKVIDTIKCSKTLIDEIYITKSISSQNVVRIYDYHLEPTKAKCYLVLELCNQGSLDGHKPHPGQNLSHSLHLKTLYRYFQQILKGLRPLYDLNIMHRDLKLSNVLLNDGVVKISDFGFAKQMGNFSQLNSVKCGTITTMAPEILFGEKSQVTFNKKSDIWSLGVMLHELVYGIHPFDMNLNDIANGKRVKIDNVYPLAEDFIRNALNYDLSERMSWEEVFIHPINFIDDDEVFFKKQIDTIRYHENGNINNMFEGKAGRKGRNFIRNSKGMHNQKKRNREEFEKNLVIVLLVVLFGLMLYLL